VSLTPFVSIVVNNYNYGRFLPEAIDSALGQAYPGREIIVVDDGSTDGSREVISGYGDRVLTVLKENGGQASAFNAGLKASRGDVILFLDADDVLLPTAVESAVRVFERGRPAKVHWPLWIIDAQGTRTGRVWPGRRLPEGDFREITRRSGPSIGQSPPTSGNAWARGFLESVFPVPEEYRLCADDYLYALAPAFGPIGRVPQPQGCYRLHGRNGYLTKSFDERLELGCRIQEQQCAVLERYFAGLDVAADVPAWREGMWFHRLRRAVGTIEASIPADGTFVLVDEDQWGAGDAVRGRRRLHFVERNGRYWGPPADDTAAICELERLRRGGADFVVFAWPSLWWLDHYPALNEHLRKAARKAWRDDDLAVFDLRDAGGDALRPTREDACA
jgi:glycosyltransferase involved in cell wall biosynthesis